MTKVFASNDTVELIREMCAEACSQYIGEPLSQERLMEITQELAEMYREIPGVTNAEIDRPGHINLSYRPILPAYDVRLLL